MHFFIPAFPVLMCFIPSSSSPALTASLPLLELIAGSSSLISHMYRFAPYVLLRSACHACHLNIQIQKPFAFMFLSAKHCWRGSSNKANFIYYKQMLIIWINALLLFCCPFSLWHMGKLLPQLAQRATVETFWRDMILWRHLIICMKMI